MFWICAPIDARYMLRVSATICLALSVTTRKRQRLAGLAQTYAAKQSVANLALNKVYPGLIA